jgi:hypothetical protein
MTATAQLQTTDIVPSLVPTPSSSNKRYSVVAWNHDELDHKVVHTELYSLTHAEKLAKEALLHDEAEYTGVKDLTKEFPYWEKVYTFNRKGELVESVVE